MKKNYKSLILALLCAIVIGFTGCKKDVEVIPATTVCDKSEMSELKNVVSSEEQLLDLIKKVSAEFEAIDKIILPANMKGRAVDEATSPETAVEQIDEYIVSFVKAVQDSISQLENINLDDFDIENIDEAEWISIVAKIFDELKFQFTFDKSINIGKISVSDWINVVSQALEDFYKEFESEISATMREADLPAEDDVLDDILSEIFEELPKTKEEIKNQLLEGLEIASLKGAEAVELLDKYCVIEKLGIGTKIVFNIDMGKYIKNDADYLNETMVNIELNGKISYGIKNLNKLYKLAADSDEIEVPLKGCLFNVDGDMKLKFTTADIKSWISLIAKDDLGGLLGGLFGSMTDTPTVTTASLNGKQEVLLAVCTKDGEGGYFTVSVKENVGIDDFVDVLETILTEEDEEKLEKEITDYLDSAVTVDVSVSDGEIEVWSKKYSLKSFSEFLDSIEGPEIEE